MQYIITIVWALLIGSALGYILTNMAGQPFDLVQSATFSGAVFVAIVLIDALLKPSED